MRRTETFRTWTVGHCVKVAVGQHEVLGAALGLQPHGDVGDPVIEAGEAAQEVDGEGAGGPLDVHRQLVGPRRRLSTDAFNLLQQVADRQDFVLVAADRPRPNAGDLLQVLSEDVPMQSDCLFSPHSHCLYKPLIDEVLSAESFIWKHCLHHCNKSEETETGN